MGFLIQKNIRDSLDKTGVNFCYAAIAACLVAIAINVAFFALFPRLLSPLAVILSNAVTLLITALAFRPVNVLVQKTLSDRSQELARQIEKEQALVRQVDDLQNKNRELENKLDIRSQTDTVPPDVNFTFKLEQMEFSKKGYIVKEEPLAGFVTDPRFEDKIPAEGVFGKMIEALGIKEPGIRKILYIDKYYYKVSIGIDFSKIKYTLDENRIRFAGVKFIKLHDITNELERDEEDINHCWIVETQEDRANLRHSDEFGPFKETYCQLQHDQTRQALEEEVESLCRQYTVVFRDSLKQRFPHIDFVDDEALLNSETSWYALKDGTRDGRVIEMASSMLMLTNVMNKTQAIDDQTNI